MRRGSLHHEEPSPFNELMRALRAEHAADAGGRGGRVWERLASDGALRLITREETLVSLPTYLSTHLLTYFYLLTSLLTFHETLRRPSQESELTAEEADAFALSAGGGEGGGGGEAARGGEAGACAAEGGGSDGEVDLDDLE